MKSRRKVLTQKHIKEIPVGMFGFGRRGLITHGIEPIQMSQKEKRKNRKQLIKSHSRRMNRVS